MVSTEGYSEGTLGPNCDAQSTVCLLDADATEELHNVPLDVDQPPAPQDSAPECVVLNTTKKELNCWCDSWDDCLGVLLLLIILFIALACFGMSLYMIYQHFHHTKLLQTLTERLDAQSQILRQIATNQHIAGYNPRGL